MHDATPLRYLAAAGFVPICLAGGPLSICLLSYLGTSSLSRVFSWSLTRADSPAAMKSLAAPTPPQDS